MAHHYTHPQPYDRTEAHRQAEEQIAEQLVARPQGMLVLTREVGERIDLTAHSPAEVELVVVGIQGGRVRLGFVAPRKLVDIHRREVSEQIEAQAAGDSQATSDLPAAAVA